jgi:hypothetical protein
MNVKKYVAALACGLMLIVSACQGKGSLLNSVPADAAAVMTVNIKKLGIALDTKTYGGTMTAEETADKFLAYASDSARKQIKALFTTDIIDGDIVAGFVASGNSASISNMLKTSDYIYTFLIKDTNKLIASLGKKSEKTDEGFDIYPLDGAFLYIKDDQGWIMADDNSAKILSQQLTLAENKSILSMKGVGEYLKDNDNIVRLAIPTSANAEDKGWACVSADIDDNGKELEFEAKSIDVNGKELNMSKDLQNIDPKLLKYTMPSDVFVMAAGISPNTDWDKLVNYASTLQPLDFKQRAFIGMLLPYLKRIDGTVLIAAGPTVEEHVSAANFSNAINFVVAIQMKKDQVKATMKELGGVISMMGLSANNKGDEYVLQFPGMAAVTLKSVDNNSIVLTNRPLQQLGNDAATKVMKGNAFGLWTNISNSFGEATYGGRGFKLTMELENDLEATFGFNGTVNPIIEELASLVSPSNNVNVNGMTDTDFDDMGFSPIDTIK